MNDPTVPTRNATLADLAALLKDQQAHKLDMVIPATKMACVDGDIIVGDTGEVAPHPVHGIVAGGGRFRPTAVCDEGIAEKLKIPITYLRRLREEHIGLYDANVNGWLERDQRNFFLRTFVGDDEVGIARSLTSDKFKTIDHLDTLGAMLDGAKEAKANITVDGCDLSERRMYVRFVAPEVNIYCPRLLGDYRSPYSGRSGSDLPVISAGLYGSNSETGGGAAVIGPRMVVQICSNGMTRTIDAIRAVHLGGRQDEGVVRWSDDTNRKALELIAAKSRDAVATFLNVDYMQRVVDEMLERAETKVTKIDETFKVIAKTLSYDQPTLDGILDHFIRGGDTSAGGVFHAVTSFAQSVADPDAAFDLEVSAWRAMELAAA